MIAALRMAASGEKAETAKPMKVLGPGIFEIALRHLQRLWSSMRRGDG
jgi:hypothetical protein